MSIENFELDLDVFGVAGVEETEVEQTESLEVSSFPNSFFTACDDTSKHFRASIIKDAKGLQYLVTQTIANKLGSDAKSRHLCLAQHRTGENFVLSTPAPTPATRNNSWVSSAQSGLKKAMEKEVRVTRFEDSYRVIESQRPPRNIVWPDLSLEEILEKAFEDRFITDMEHPVIAELLGF